MKTCDSQPLIDRRQRKLLSFVTRYAKRHQYAPSLQEVADHVGVTVSRACQLVEVLEAAGYLSHVPGAARTLHVTAAGRRV